MFALVSVIATVFPFVPAPASAAAVQARPPNVLFIAVDDLNACLAGMHGETTVDTPNLNRLAARGVLFTNAHCAAPACNPSRTAVLTGLAPATTGVYSNPQDWRDNAKLRSWRTLPAQFAAHGYEVRGGGKLYHAASLSKRMITGYLDPKPWDEYFPSKDRQLPPEVQPPDGYPVNGNKAFYGGHFDWAALDIEPEEMGDAKTVAWAEKHLARAHDRPLFLAVGIYRPHIPWWTPKQYFDAVPLADVELPEIVPGDLDDVPPAGQAMARRKWHRWLVQHGKWRQAVQAYNASVRFADDMVGRLLDALDAGPLAENTVIVLWSDHGYHLGQKEHWEKFALWEQTTRVPFIVVAPGVARVGATCAQPVSLLDIYPTLNALCGFTGPDGLDGENIVPLLREPDKKTGRAVVITHLYNNHAVRSADWRYIRYADGSEELYDQRTDPKNFTNLAGRPELRGIIRDLARWLPKTNAPKDPLANSQREPAKKQKGADRG